MKNNNPGAAVDVTDSFVATINGKPQVGAGATVFRTDDTELREAYNAELAKNHLGPAEISRDRRPLRVYGKGTAGPGTDHRQTVLGYRLR